jgi:hypothetical protein
MKRLLVLLLIISTVPVYSNYYADIEFDVRDDGIVRIQGNSNHPNLANSETSELTSKNGRYWLLNISIDNKFSDYIYQIKLPKYSSVNYLKTPGLSRFEYGNDNLIIIGTGENRTFNVVVQYTIEKWKDNFLFAAITLGFALVIVLFYWLGVSRKAHRMTYSQNKSD